MDKLYFRKELYKFLAYSRNFSNYMFPDEPLCSVQLWSCTCRGVGWTVYCRSWSSPPPLVKLPGAFLWTSWHPGVGSIVDSSDPHIHGLMRNSFLVHPETILSIRLVEKTQLYLILGKPPNSPKIWNIENFHILTLWKISTPFILTFKRVRVTLKSSSEQRVRFYSLERSSPLLDIGQGTWDIGYRTWDMGHGTWDMGYGIWDMGHRT